MGRICTNKLDKKFWPSEQAAPENQMAAVIEAYRAWTHTEKRQG